jgi:hypothetical protein
MNALKNSTTAASLEDRLDTQQLRILSNLRSPVEIQAFLDETPYSTEYANRSPLRVMQDRVAHCLDGGLFAAAALRRLGYPPIIVDLLPEPGTDDDHVLAIYRVGGYFGAVAKSNFAGLRLREPVYRTYRELVLSYFEVYFNVHGQKTLRAYSVPLNLATMDSLDWECSDAGIDAVEHRLMQLRRTTLVTPEMAARLSPVDELSYRSGTLATNPAGLYKPCE